MSGHTPGPMNRNPFPPQKPLEVAGLHLAHFSKGAGGGIPEANARRICAAWNACEGIPTEALEAGVVKDILEALRGCKAAMCEASNMHNRSAQVLSEHIHAARAAIARATGESK